MAARLTETKGIVRTLMSKIFLSYRRSDSADVAGRIFDHLRQNFRKDDLFKDVDSIPPGEDFRTFIGEKIKACDVVIVIIGRGWLTATDRGGIRRLDEAGDYVRLEIEAALERTIPIIPVLVGGAEMPSSELLPVPLQPLAFRNAVSVRPDPDFNNDIARLVRSLRNIVKKDSLLNQARKLGRFRNLMVAVLLIGALLLLLPIVKKFSRITESGAQNGVAQRTAQNNEQPGASGDVSATAGPIITDARNGLMWTKSDNGVDINWAGAVKYCQDLSLGGYDDWQLPYKNELAATTDLDLSEVNRISKNFQLSRKCCFWTSSEETSNYAWVFDFSADQQTLGKADQSGLRALCIRHYRN